VVTGNALTVKYDTNGNQLWTAPYDGSGIAVDGGGNSIVTGYGSGFNTVKLNQNGSNLWSQSYVSTWGPALSQAVVVDGGGNTYVAGSDTYICYQEGAFRDCYAGLLTVKYDPSGNQLWINIPTQGAGAPQVAGMAADSENNLYLEANVSYGNVGFRTFRYSSDGALMWMVSPGNGTGPGNALALDTSTNVLLVGQDAYAFNGSYSYYYTTFKLNSSGATLWTNHYPQPPVGSSAATSVATDSASNVYITGSAQGTNSFNNIVTIKYSPTGNQIWLQSYNGSGNGAASGNAIAVDNTGNVYVAGYDTTTAGGTEMVLIKYSPVTLQRKPDGTVLLETQGSPGESFNIEASADLLNWLDLGTVLADTNGLMMFDDTNAPSFPSRFYYTKPQ
jgi:hypothetical protein